MRCFVRASNALRRLRVAGMLCVVAVLAVGHADAQAPQGWPLWDAYAKRFVDDQGRVIDRSAQDRSTSEGQAYALFFALVDNDRPRFDKLLTWTEANLAQGDLTSHLPAWDWGKNADGAWKPVDQNSAADADLWMAYTLLEAGRLWKEPRFRSLGKTMAARIAQEEVVQVPGVGTTLAPGPKGFHSDAKTWTLNPSYLPLSVLVYLSRTLPQGPWADVLKSMPKLLDRQIGKGYAMDWVAAAEDGIRAAPSPAQASAGPHNAQPGGSYDAIRVYLWLGIANPATPGRHDLLSDVGAMGTYLRTALTPPLEVDAKGFVVHADGTVGFSAAVLPYLEALGLHKEAKAQADRLSAMRDPATSLYGHQVEYYDQNLVLFSTGWSEQRYRFEADGKLHVRWK